MDFDMFDQGTEEPQNTNTQDENLVGYGNTVGIGSTDSFDNIATDDAGWNLDNNLTDTAPQSNTYDDNLLDGFGSAPSTQQELFTDDGLTSNQPVRNGLDSSFTNNIVNTTTKSPTETSSYDMFAAPIASQITNQINETGISSPENLSALEAFNIRRQKEIAEKDAEEKRKNDALRQQAKNDIERWYQERSKRMEKNRENIQQEEDELRRKALEKSDTKSCDWAKVIRFLEFSQGSQLSKAKRELSRMKTSIINAKRDNDKRLSTSQA